MKEKKCVSFYSLPLDLNLITCPICLSVLQSAYKTYSIIKI